MKINPLSKREAQFWGGKSAQAIVEEQNLTFGESARFSCIYAAREFVCLRRRRKVALLRLKKDLKWRFKHRNPIIIPTAAFQYSFY